MNAQETPDAYFDEMWGKSADPWDHAGRFYESRKYDITAAVLDRPRFRRAFEPGCGIGLLTERLAPRCDELIATDRDERACRTTAARAEHRAGVRTSVGRLPTDWPDGTFDLIVLSEVLYYLTTSGVADVLDRATEAAEPGAQLIAVHYRRPVTVHALGGDQVHDLVLAHPMWQQRGTYVDDDFRLDSLVRR